MKPDKQDDEKAAKYEDQDEWGNSLAMIKKNLTLTPLERLRQADILLRFARKYRGAARARTRD